MVGQADVNEANRVITFEIALPANAVDQVGGRAVEEIGKLAKNVVSRVGIEPTTT